MVVLVVVVLVLVLVLVVVAAVVVVVVAKEWVVADMVNHYNPKVHYMYVLGTAGMVSF